ncbi:hypothetical protein HYH98_14960 [Clostridium botulinum]|nr:hypothetical protein [Clostridium botulinum]
MKGDGGMAGAPKGNKNAKGNKGGAPAGNKNAVGNKGGAPVGNLNSLKHGEYFDAAKHLEKDFLKKYIPTATKNIIKETVECGISTLDILWTNIQLQFAAIIRSQKIMHVKSKSEMIKEIKKSKIKSKTRSTEKTSTDETEEEFSYEFQFAWDRQATFLNTQSKAISTLQNLISKYEELLHKNWELASDEQKIRVAKLKAEVAEITGENEDEETEDDGFIEALNGTAKEDWSDEEE